MSAPSIDAFTTGYFLSACTTAFTKNDMKPSFTPWFFSNFSLYRLRRSMTACILTSLKVVRIAAVDCDCTRRSATRWRKRDIGTRCSGRAPAADGFASDGMTLRARSGGAAVDGAVAGSAFAFAGSDDALAP